jgi:hypothetical protein
MLAQADDQTPKPTSEVDLKLLPGCGARLQELQIRAALELLTSESPFEFRPSSYARPHDQWVWEADALC